MAISKLQECDMMKKSQKCNSNRKYIMNENSESQKQERNNNINTLNNEIDADNVSIKEESPEDTDVTNDDLNTDEQMNAAQINTNPETRDELPETEVLTAIFANHMYNLRAQPTEKTKIHHDTGQTTINS